MQTRFLPEQLADPAMAASEAVIRKCVHCGFCTATCPTYVLLGDELDSPRGRIYLMKEMLEGERTPTAEVVKHIDRCLSCLSCMTTCPSGVNYMHLVDHARAYIEARYRRPMHERLIRALLAAVLPHPRRFRLALALARLARPASMLFTTSDALRPLGAMLSLAPAKARPKPSSAPSSVTAAKGRVALVQGCVEPVLRPEFRAAAVRLLNRAGYDVIFPSGEGCCGALVHHMGREADGLAAARRNVDAWDRQIVEGGLDAILTTASGCGTTIKDYGFMLRSDPHYAEKAKTVSALTQDVSEFLLGAGLPAGDGRGLTVAYHDACSLQHGQGVSEAPKRLLREAGYAVRTPRDAHLCCGSAGTYTSSNRTSPPSSATKKWATIERLSPDVIATGNIGCTMQIAQRTQVPVVHTVELLDWATGGPRPMSLKQVEAKNAV